MLGQVHHPIYWRLWVAQEGLSGVRATGGCCNLHWRLFTCWRGTRFRQHRSDLVSTLSPQGYVSKRYKPELPPKTNNDSILEGSRIKTSLHSKVKQTELLSSSEHPGLFLSELRKKHVWHLPSSSGSQALILQSEELNPQASHFVILCFITTPILMIGNLIPCSSEGGRSLI